MRSDLTEKSGGTWDLRSFQEHPVLRFGDNLLILDEGALLARITAGVYWYVHDHEKATRGDKGRQAWTMAWGDIVEAATAEMLQRLTIPVLGASAGAGSFTEDDIEAAYPHSPHGAKRADFGIDFGDTICIFDATKAQLTTGTRSLASRDSFAKDMDKIVFDKALQLDQTARKLIDDESPLTGVSPAIPRRLMPVVVTDTPFPYLPPVERYIQEQLEARGLFTEHLVGSLGVITFAEVEMLAGVTSKGSTAARELEGWRSSPLHGSSLRNFLIDRYGREKANFQTAAQDQAINDTLNGIVALIDSWQ